MSHLRHAEKLRDVCAASFAEQHLPRLAPLRTHPDVQARCSAGRTWLRWLAPDDDVLGCVLPIPEAQLFQLLDGHWYPLGSRLPAFDVQFETGMTSLQRLLVPVLPETRAADEFARARVPVQLVSSAVRQRVSAALTTLVDLDRWAEQIPGRALEGLRAMRSGDEVLLIGRPLPVLPGAQRFWGSTILVPLGYRLEPSVPERALRTALGVAEGELLLFDRHGVEVLPGEAFEPITRSGIKLALHAES